MNIQFNVRPNSIHYIMQQVDFELVGSIRGIRYIRCRTEVVGIKKKEKKNPLHLSSHIKLNFPAAFHLPISWRNDTRAT